MHALRSSFRRIGLLAAVAAACLPQAFAETLRGPFGSPAAARHEARTRTFDLRHVLVHLDLTGEFGTITGDVRLALDVIASGTDTIALDAVEMEISATRLADGVWLTHRYDGRRLTIELDRVYEPGESVEIQVRYHARPQRGLHFTAPDENHPDRPVQIWSQGEPEETRYWIPIYDSPDDKTTTELIVAVPKTMTAISNGELVENPPGADDTRFFHWKQTTPHSTYLISLVAGSFDRHTETRSGVPLEYYVPPGTPRTTVYRSFASTPDMLTFFEDYIGQDYPWARYAQVAVHDFIFGGMENTAATTLNADTLHPASSEPNFASESLVAHELAHQWFGNSVTTRDWPNIWLNEGFATFFTQLWFEKRYGEYEYDYRRFLAAERYFKEDEEKYRRPIVWDTYVHPLDLFDAHAYQKGAVVLTMLRGEVGDDAFRRAIRNYAKSHARGLATTEDFERAVSEAAGRDLGWFFDQWLYRSGHPELEVTTQWDDENGLLRVWVDQVQDLDEQTTVFRIPVDIAISTTLGIERRSIVIESASETFSFELSQPPRWVRFDPDQIILKRLAFEQPTENLIIQVRGDPSIIGRIWAGKELTELLDAPEVVDALRTSLTSDPFYGVRAELAAAIGKTGELAALDLLVEATRDRDARVREKVAKALGEFEGDAEAAAALDRLIRKDGKPYVVGAALEALGKTRVSGVRATLEKALGRDSHREVIRAGALKGLGELGDPEVLPVVLSWAEPSRPRHARVAAITALGKLGTDDDGVRRRLEALLEDPSMWARRAAAKALGKRGDADAIAALEAMHAGELDRRVQREVEDALEDLNEPDEEPTEKQRLAL